MSHSPTRREFLRDSALAGAAAGLAVTIGRRVFGQDPPEEPLFKISLAGYSFHRAMEQGRLDPRDLAPYVKENFGIEAVEQWNTPFLEMATNAAYLGEMKQKAADAGVQFVLIMIDNEGNVGAPDVRQRIQVVDNHKKWVDAAKQLGCHAIRVNARSQGTDDEQAAYCIDGLRQLSQYADALDINVIVENHGGLSSNGAWLAKVLTEVGLENCGALPDFGNFPGLVRGGRFPAAEGDRGGRRGGGRGGRGGQPPYDPYQGVAEMMPFAKGVSAKSYDFAENGEETSLDYKRMLKIVVDAGFRGHVGVEYEGNRLSEDDGARATKALLEKTRDELAAEMADNV
jgi:sugar phosphate isomerase/epimerase